MVQNKIFNHNYSPFFKRGIPRFPLSLTLIFSHWNNLQHKEATVKAKRKVRGKNNSICFDIWIQEAGMRDTNMIFISKKTPGQMFWESPERTHQILQKILPPRTWGAAKCAANLTKRQFRGLDFGFFFLVHKIITVFKSVYIKTEFVWNKRM